MTAIKDYLMLIDGAWVAASDGGMFDSVNPADGEVWARVPEATAEDVDRAVRAAHLAGTTGPWATMTPSARGKCLRRLGDLLAERSEDLGRIETVDTGKMLKETRWQAKYIAEFYHFYAGAADKIAGETLPIDKPDLFVFTRREPLGVVAAIVPWNSATVSGGGQAGAGAGGGQYGGAEGVGTCGGPDAGVCGAVRGGGLSAGGGQCGQRARRAVRAGPDLASFGGAGVVHRGAGGGAADLEQCAGKLCAGVAGTGRQIAVHRV